MWLRKIKITLEYIMDLFIYNKEGWYIGKHSPMPSDQSFRVMIGQKVYTPRVCPMCKREYWAYKKAGVCFRIECFYKYKLRSKNA